jgi:hypothetical protein
MVQHEDRAAEAVRAGYLVEVAGGEVSHQSADGEKPSRFLVATDNRDVGMELGDEYVEGDDACQYLACSGGGVHLYLAGGESVASGDALLSAGDGTVRAADTGGETPDDPAAAVAFAAEALDADDEPAAISTEVAH